MRLAFSTNAFTQFSLGQALEEIAAVGFGGVEILADVPHAYPDERLSQQQCESIRRQLDRLGLSVSNINANCSFGYWKDAPPEPYFEPSLISPNPKHRADRIGLIRNAMRLGRAVGAANISITSGRMLAGMPPDLADKQFAQSIAQVLEAADEFNINVGIECEPGLFLEYADELKQWIDRIGHPRLGANLDIGHCQVIGESIAAAIELLADRIWNLHVEDIPGRKHYHLIPGQGTIDWEAVRMALQKINYQHFLTVELYTHTADPRSAAQQSLKFLTEHFPQPG
jgi:sugar phosphate isomerase/epimerase